MNREDYEKSKDYIEAMQLIRMFIEDVLEGDITKLINNDISMLIRNVSDGKKRDLYLGNIDDPDMFKITQAIYIVLWGDIYNLTFENMGPWGEKKNPFRGDTMNSFNSVYGKNMLIAKRYGLNSTLMNSVTLYQLLYHSIGNFVVIPNRMDINRRRANYYTIQDYFDSFVGAIYQYQNQNSQTEYWQFFEELNVGFIENPEYKDLPFESFIENFFLDKYVKNGKPYNVFDLSYDLRKKEYIGRNKRSKAEFFSKKEYTMLAKKYFDVASDIITYRGEKIVERLKNCI